MDFCAEPKSSKEILEYLGLSYHSYTLKKVVQPLVENYYIFPTAQRKKGNVTTYISRESIAGK